MTTLISRLCGTFQKFLVEMLSIQASNRVPVVMIQQALFRQSRRALSSGPWFSWLSPFTRLQVPRRPVGIFSQLGRNPATASRCYSSETETTKNTENDAAAT